MWAALARLGATEIPGFDGCYYIPPITKKQSIQRRASWQRNPQENWQAAFWQRQESDNCYAVFGKQLYQTIRNVLRAWLLPYKDYNRRLNPQRYKKRS